MPHTIRLRGPWELEPLERYLKRDGGGYESSTARLPTGERVTMPADWCATLGRDFLGVVRFSRNFNLPTNLGPNERVWLVVEPPRSCGRVRVNDQACGCVRFGAAAGRFDITPFLKDFNRVEVDVEHPNLGDDRCALDDGSALVPGGLVGEVRLEIED